MVDRSVYFELTSWNYSNWQKRFIEHLNDAGPRWEIHRIYAEMTEKYVPYKTGDLNEHVYVDNEYIIWGYRGFSQDYAIFPYMGTRNGKKLNYTTTFHPLARDHWDRAVMKYDSRAFKWRVTHALKRMAKEEGW